jgi:hypothetical protein
VPRTTIFARACSGRWPSQQVPETTPAPARGTQVGFAQKSRSLWQSNKSPAARDRGKGLPEPVEAGGSGCCPAAARPVSRCGECGPSPPPHRLQQVARSTGACQTARNAQPTTSLCRTMSSVSPSSKWYQANCVQCQLDLAADPTKPQKAIHLSAA